MQRLLIIDGNHIMHRAFHAFPPLTTPEGKPVQAVYGFFSMLIKVMEEVKPTHIAVCFDRAAPTFRKQMYAGYQAQRPQMADDLSGQFILMHQALEKIGIPIFEVDGYEADDLIGTLAFQAGQNHESRITNHESKDKVIARSHAKRDDEAIPTGSSRFARDDDKFETIILSGDRDLLQLVDAHTSIFAPIVGITKFILFDEQTVKEKYGIDPVQIVDYKALVGDASDGYPGVTGIGPKTAAGLLHEYKTLEGLYTHIGVLPEKIGKKLATDAEQAALCKKLATIVRDAPAHLDLEKADVKNFTREKVIVAFDEFGFNTIKKRTGVFPHEEKIPTSKKKIERSKDQMELI